MNNPTSHTTTEFDVQTVRKEFPALHQKVNGAPLVYFDNGATTQKPMAVIDAISNYYKTINSNVHRGVHSLSQRATDAFEAARTACCMLINARENREIVFTKGTTESINLLASALGKGLEKGDEIIITEMEHHSNIVPWQMIAGDKGAVIKYIPVNDKGELQIETLESLITPKTKLLAISHVSNTLGTINPVKALIATAHQHGVTVFVDGAQAAPHLKIDVQELDCDYYALSAHKLFGPTGIGILYGKAGLLEALPPYQGGGAMIKTVRMEGTEFDGLPNRFEAGTPDIAGAVGLKATIDYLDSIDIDARHRYESELLEYATEKLKGIEGLRIIGEADEKVSVISFVVDGIHPFDIGTLLDQLGIAVRTGHHCTQPLMERFGIPGTIRASLAFYNTFEEIDRLVAGVQRAIKMLS